MKKIKFGAHSKQSLTYDNNNCYWEVPGRLMCLLPILCVLQVYHWGTPSEFVVPRSLLLLAQTTTTEKAPEFPCQDLCGPQTHSVVTLGSLFEEGEVRRSHTACHTEHRHEG